jgi:hypothetical protein
VGNLPSGGSQNCLSSANQFASNTADGLTWTEWTNGTGGCLTSYNSATAFSTSWNNGSDYLARLGQNFSGSRAYTTYGTIAAQFAETKTGNAGGYSFIGIYGWMWSPCVEFYIVEDSFNGMPVNKSNITATIDGGTYYLITNSTTGTGGNNCESGHSGGWTQMWSVRTTARDCGTITISDHFDAWKNQGWTLGSLKEAEVNVEVGGGTGSVDLPMANLTTTMP